MSRLLEDRRQFRQLVIDHARKDPKRVDYERRFMKLLLDEIDDINQQIDLGIEAGAHLGVGGSGRFFPSGIRPPADPKVPPFVLFWDINFC